MAVPGAETMPVCAQPTPASCIDREPLLEAVYFPNQRRLVPMEVPRPARQRNPAEPIAQISRHRTRLRQTPSGGGQGAILS
jgi:hypothetical protein